MTEECEECGGTGECPVQCDDNDLFCSICNGTGACPDCDGAGVKEAE